MRRCFELARRGAGYVSPNPMVGAVLVCEGKIIGEGWHKAWGEAHAEVNCFNAVAPENQHLVPKSTLYCSLEPCSHYGKTPPCADLIIARQVPRVLVSNTDPNPLVAGKGLARLQEAGIAVEAGILEQEGLWINRFFFHWITQKRPYVILKWAQTADGFLGEKDKRTVISGPASQRLVHRWRAESDAILVGAGTAIIDDPQLNARHYFGKNPLRVLLDGKGSVPVTRHLLSDEQPTLVFGPERAGLNSSKTFIPSAEMVALTTVLDTLRQQNLATLFVEGGAQVLQQCIKQGLWDEIRVIKSPKRLGGGLEAPRIPATAQLRESFRVGDDEVSVFLRNNSL